MLKYGTHGSWAYTEGLHRALSCLTADRSEAALLDLGLFAALLVGSMARATLQRTLFLRPPTLRQMIRSFLGGALMGFGAMLVPGSNDALVLNAMPKLTVHGWAAYAAMVAAIALCLSALRWRQ